MKILDKHKIGCYYLIVGHPETDVTPRKEKQHMSRKPDYKELRGLIIAKYGTYKNFSDHLNFSIVALYSRLSGNSEFKLKEIDQIAKALDISDFETLNRVFFKANRTNRQKQKEG